MSEDTGQGVTAACPGINNVMYKDSSDLCAAHMLSAKCEIHSISVLGQRMWTSGTEGGLVQQDSKCFYKGADVNWTDRLKGNERENTD